MKRYSKEWFARFFTRIKDEGRLNKDAYLKDNKARCGCALYHIGVRDDDKRGDYKFPNKNVKRKFTALCKALGREPFRNGYPQWFEVYRPSDRGELIDLLSE